MGLEKGVVCEAWGQGVRKGVTASVLTCRLDNGREAGASGFRTAYMASLRDRDSVINLYRERGTRVRAKLRSSPLVRCPWTHCHAIGPRTLPQ